MVAQKQIRVITWNVENLFHPETGGPRYDLTPHEGWTVRRYKAKVARVAKAIAKMITANSKGSEPFVLGLTEVENEKVVQDLLEYLPPNVAMARDPSFGHEYHDCVILYDKSTFEVVNCRYNQMFERFPRGDVVRVELRIKKSKRSFHVFCCHLKARPSNQYYTEMFRQAVCDDMQTAVWQIHDGEKVRKQIRRIKGGDKKPRELELDKNVLLMGDFNDEPFSSSLLEYLNASYDRNYVLSQKSVEKVVLYNCAWEGLATAKPGSYFYEKGKVTNWSMLDQIVVSPALLSGVAGLRYVPSSFRVEQELTADENGVPYRICSWNDDDELVWQPGYSDHFPAMITLELA